MTRVASEPLLAEDVPENREMTWMAGVASALLCMLFGANTVAIKISLTGLGVFTTAGLRFGMAAVVLALWALFTGRTLRLKKGQVGTTAAISVMFVVQLSLFYLGLSLSYASRVTLLVNLQPLFVLFLAHFFIPGDRITVRKSLGILLGFAGVAFVFMEKAGGGGQVRSGELVVLAATGIWAVSAVYVKRVIHRFQPFHVVFYPMILACPVFIIEGLLWDRSMIFDLNPRVVSALLYQGLVTASFGFVAWNTLLQRYGAVSMHAFVFIMPISGVLLGGLVLGEPITGKIVTALLLIVSGILVAHLRQNRVVPTMAPGKNI